MASTASWGNYCFLGFTRNSDCIIFHGSDFKLHILGSWEELKEDIWSGYLVDKKWAMYVSCYVCLDNLEYISQDYSLHGSGNNKKNKSRLKEVIKIDEVMQRIIKVLNHCYSWDWTLLNIKFLFSKMCISTEKKCFG